MNLADPDPDPDLTAAAAARLPDALRLGAVALTVSDLDRSVAFYQDAIGLRMHRRDDATAAMGAGGEDLVVLVEEPGARRAGRHAGLYHVALLHPSRLELARATMRLAVTRIPIEGASDHGVSEAIYLPDPDSNGIELYADRPKGRWPTPGAGERLRMVTEPLDLDALLAEVAGGAPRRHAEPGLVVGHLHLHVGDLGRGLAFYRDLVGFEPMVRFPNAAFVSAGGYHHHLGFNTWRGEGVPAPPPRMVGLRHWTVVLPGPQAVAEVRARLEAGGVAVEQREDGAIVARDPWGMALALVG